MRALFLSALLLSGAGYAQTIAVPEDVPVAIPVSDATLHAQDGTEYAASSGVFLNEPAAIEIAKHVKATDAEAADLRQAIKDTWAPPKALVIIACILAAGIGGLVGYGLAKTGL